MQRINLYTSNNSKKLNFVNNIQNYYIQVEYFDKNGKKSIKNNYPLKCVFEKNVQP